ncbi:MAG: type II secretion system protein [Planctomycetota bacterium]
MLHQTTRRRGFTLVELLVVIGVIALLIGVLLPALGGARQSARDLASAANLRQLGAGLQMYITDFSEELPQMRVDAAGEPVTDKSLPSDNIGTLFGGKLGSLPFFGIDRIGPERRPLNPYVWDDELPDDDSASAQDFELEVFRDPTDAGLQDPLLASFGFDLSSAYELLGVSYVLNDHALDDDPGTELYPTLVPKEGGRMPRVADPTRTWLCGSQPIHNYDDGQDRGMRWGGTSQVVAHLLFVDLHAEARITVPEGIVQTTADYTFLPTPKWLDRFTEPTE